MEKDSFEKTLHHLLSFLYGKEDADRYAPQFLELINEEPFNTKETEPLSNQTGDSHKMITHKDALLISYGDMLSASPEKRRICV